MKGGIYKTKHGWQVRFGGITRRFKRFEHTEKSHQGFTPAERFLNGLQYETDRGTFDIRDYQQSQPLSFRRLKEKFLLSKRKKPKAQKKYALLLSYANKLNDRNMKTIGYADFEDVLIELEDRGLASKTRYDFIYTLKMFWKWIIKREGKNGKIEMPDFPEVVYSMQYRKIVDKPTQTAILNEIYRLAWDINPRIYIGCLFLSTYFNTRPGELIKIKEDDIDYDMCRIFIKEAKTGESKYIYLLPEDVELLQGIKTLAHPSTPFFRHIKPRSGVTTGQKFGRNLLATWWNRACKNLKIEGVSLYPGTMHSTVVDLRRTRSPETIKRGSGRKSNKAFNRYLQVTGDELRSIYADTRTDNELITLYSDDNIKNDSNII